MIDKEEGKKYFLQATLQKDFERNKKDLQAKLFMKDAEENNIYKYWYGRISIPKTEIPLSK